MVSVKYLKSLTFSFFAIATLVQTAAATPLTWESVKYDFSAGWSGPEFLGYTNPTGSSSYNGAAGNGVNESIGLTGAANAAWNLNLYSFASTGVGSNLGAMFSNMGYFYSAPDAETRNFDFALSSELVFTLDRPGIFSMYSLTEDIGPFQSVKLESGTWDGLNFASSSTIFDPVSSTSSAYIGAGSYRFSSVVDANFSSNTAFGRGNNTVFQVIETVPEPATLVAVGIGVIGILRRKRRTA
jgi:hypothetical protein